MANSQTRLATDPLFPLCLRLALPTALAQAVMVLYSIVDRMFIGHIPEVGALAIAGVGIAGPITTFISSFAVLIGLGGAPLMAMKAGHGEKEEAEKYLGSALSLLLIISAIITPLFFLLKNKLILTFGASSTTFPFANEYTTFYLLGTPFALLSSGLNSFVINQGRSKTGMASVLIGAVVNIILDPIFIFTLGMGCKGAAIATVISQFASTVVTFYALTSKHTPLKLRLVKPERTDAKKICTYGLSPFIIIATDSLLLILLNTVLQRFSAGNGDMLITAATIIQSYHLLVMNPLGGITGGCQAMVSYNYGAGLTSRVKKGIFCVEVIAFTYIAIIFATTYIAGENFISLFTSNVEIQRLTYTYLKVFTFGIPLLALQYTNVDSFTAMGQIKFSLPFSLFRKAIFLVTVLAFPPLFGAESAFFAEPVCDIISGILSTFTMIKCLPKILQKRKMNDLQL